ncbi:MAG: S41 family peptidase [Bacteroidaceae bacterium]|nr:S41 family peptidase [Bacteroidaceae bacterium]
MKVYKLYLLLLTIIGCTSCITEDVPDNTPSGNFEALWKIIDEQYCFLDYKKEAYGLDWDEVYRRYKEKLTDDMSSKELFQVLAAMLNELRDGHVNLVAYHETSQYRAWYDNYPANFSDSLQRNYLGKDYTQAGGLKYQILEDNIGYVYYSSFSTVIGESNLDAILDELSVCDGLILDVRNNGGGLLTMSERLAARFTNEKILTGYMTHKTGKGHNDFSAPEAIYTEPSTDRVRWQKPVAVLTNRRSYSSTNDFVNRMKQMPKAIIVGDKTGGGSGLPFSSELPNGWSVRFSASPMYTPDMEHIEFGIEPDIKVDITSEDYQKGIDTIIETARESLKAKKE